MRATDIPTRHDTPGQLSAPGPVANLRLITLPLPPERDGWVRIRVEAFGLNRSELKLRLGVSTGVSFPRCRVSRYTSVPLSQVIPVDTDLPWEVLGALPAMVQTAYGSLTIGLDLRLIMA